MTFDLARWSFTVWYQGSVFYHHSVIFYFPNEFENIKVLFITIILQFPNFLGFRKLHVMLWIRMISYCFFVGSRQILQDIIFQEIQGSCLDEGSKVQADELVTGGLQLVGLVQTAKLQQLSNIPQCDWKRIVASREMHTLQSFHGQMCHCWVKCVYELISKKSLSLNPCCNSKALGQDTFCHGIVPWRGSIAVRHLDLSFFLWNSLFPMLLSSLWGTRQWGQSTLPKGIVATARIQTIQSLSLLMLWSHHHVKARPLRQFSWNWVGRGYLVAAIGSKWLCGVYVPLFFAKIALHGSCETALC